MANSTRTFSSSSQRKAEFFSVHRRRASVRRRFPPPLAPIVFFVLYIGSCAGEKPSDFRRSTQDIICGGKSGGYQPNSVISTISKGEFCNFNQECLQPPDVMLGKWCNSSSEPLPVCITKGAVADGCYFNCYDKDHVEVPCFMKKTPTTTPSLPTLPPPNPIIEDPGFCSHSTSTSLETNKAVSAIGRGYACRNAPHGGSGESSACLAMVQEAALDCAAAMDDGTVNEDQEWSCTLETLRKRSNGGCGWSCTDEIGVPIPCFLVSESSSSGTAFSTLWQMSAALSVLAGAAAGAGVFAIVWSSCVSVSDQHLEAKDDPRVTSRSIRASKYRTDDDDDGDEAWKRDWKPCEQEPASPIVAVKEFIKSMAVDKA